MRRHLALIALASTAALALASCGSSGNNAETSSSRPSAGTSSSSDSPGDTSSAGTDSSTSDAPVETTSDAPPVPGGPVITRLNQDAGTLDPALSTVGGQTIDTYLYDPLIHFQLDGTIVSGIAKDWTVQPDSATFTLRDDVTCTDGHVITPADVKATYDHLKDPETKATWIVSQLGTTDYTVEADDAADTVTITLPTAFGDLMNGIAQIGIVCPDGIKDPSALTAGSDGTGPFTLDTATPDVEYVLKARPDYTWGPDGAATAVDGFPSEVVFKVVKDDSTAVNMFTRGELNLLSMTGSEATRLEGDASVTKSEKVASQGAFMVFNQISGRVLAGEPALAVRKALAQATNRQDLMQVATGGLGQTTDSLVNQNPKTCNDDAAAAAVPQFDVAAANAALDAAGWPKGADGIRAKDGKKLTVILLANEASQAGWEYLQQSWSSELGIDAQIVTLDNSSATERLLGGGDWDVAMIRIVTNVPSAWLQFLTGEQPPNGLNLGSVNKTYAELATKAQSLSGQEACDLWEQAETSAFDQMDIFPLYSPQSEWFGHDVDFVPVWDEAVQVMSLRTAG